MSHPRRCTTGCRPPLCTNSKTEKRGGISRKRFNKKGYKEMTETFTEEEVKNKSFFFLFGGKKSDSKCESQCLIVGFASE